MALSLEQRFWAKVNKNGPTQPHMDTPCWEWTGAKFKQGYGRMVIDGLHKYAHRIGWLIQTGKEPTYLRHRCDNVKCVRADHLIDGADYAEAHAQNIREAEERGLINHAKGSRVAGSKLNEDAVKEIRSRAAKGESHRTLGRDYGVSHVSVGYIVRRKTWRHVA